MTKIVHEVVVSCPPDRVFALLSDVERLPEFSEMTVEVKNGPGRPLQAGDRFDQVIKVVGVEFDTEWEVTEVETGKLIRIEGRSKSNGRASLTETLTPDGEGCRVRLEVDYDPPLGIIGEIADKLVFERRHEDEAEHVLAGLKALCEAVPAS
jgi:uncharacterized membrane protein